MAQDRGSTPPSSERRPSTERIHGVEIVDPYAWLADRDEAVEEWTGRQNAYADRILDSPTREPLHARFEELARTTEYFPVSMGGPTYFQRIEHPDDEHPVLTVRDSLAADRQVIVDPNDWDKTTSMGWYCPAKSGELVAYGVATGGDEHYDIRVADRDGTIREELPKVGRVGPRSVAWTDDGFYYQHTGTVGDGAQLDKGIAYHELGTDPRDDSEIDADLGPRQWPSLHTAADGTLVVAVDEMSIRSDLFVCSPGETELRPVVTGEDALFFPTVETNTVYVATTHDAPNRRVIAIDVQQYAEGNQSVADFDVAVPEADQAVVDSIVVTQDGLVVHRHRDACSALALFDPETGDRLRQIPLAEHVQTDELSACAQGSTAFFRVQSFDRPASIVRTDTDTGETTELDRSGGEIDTDVTISREHFESADATPIPAFVVRRSDLDPDGTNPSVVYGYGGFRNNMLPTYRRYAVPFITAGGVFVQAVLRGGTEYGEEWHRAGMRDRKQNVFDDFYAVAEGVIDHGWADPTRIAAMGRSNGGLLVGVAITQRPDLWTAGVAGVPLMDMLRFHRFLLGEAWTNEYGSPADADAFEYLREYSPYHNVTERDYPATLLHTAAGDSRVHPGHARKMTARLQHNQTGDRPIVLRTHADTGHGVGTPTSIEVKRNLDEWTFLFDQLGLGSR